MKDVAAHSPEVPSAEDLATAIKEHEADGSKWAELSTRKKNTLVKQAMSTRHYLELCNAIMVFRANKD